MSNQKLKEEFIDCFGQIMLLENSAQDGSVSGGGFSRIIVRAGEVKHQFYTDEHIKLDQLKKLQNRVAEVKKSSQITPEQQKVIRRFEAASKFVSKKLFPADNNVTVVRSSRQYPASATAGRANDMRQAAELIAALANGWRLDVEIAGMEILLQKVSVLAEVYEKNIVHVSAK